MNELLEQLEQEFKKTKSELKFKPNLDQIDKIFPIKDLTVKENYIPVDLSRSICRGLVDTLHNWSGYLHGLLVPNPHHMLSMTEAQVFNEKEKEEVFELLAKIMDLSSRNALISLNSNKNQESKLIDEIVNFWESTLNSKLQEIMKKVNSSWVEKAKNKK